MFNYLSSNLEFIITSFIISLLVILIYDLVKKIGKVHLHVNKLKVNVQNKNNWKEENIINDDTRGVDLDIQLELYNHKNNNNSIRRIKIVKRHFLKFKNIENSNLNLTDTLKTVSGATTYEKLKYINLLANETKVMNVKVKLEPEEFTNLKKNPIISFK